MLQYAIPSEPAAGQIYSFRTRPLSEFAPSPTNRFAALKILGASAELIVIAVVDGIWTTAPTLQEVRASSTLEERRFAYTGRPAVFGVNREWWKPDGKLDEWRYVGTQVISPTEQAHVNAINGYAPGSRYSTLGSANSAAEGEWRWSHDREAFVAEQNKVEALQKAERAAREERYRNRLSKLTWEQLATETPFENWSPSPPFPPEEFTSSARTTIRNACDALKELGPKPRKADVRRILKQTVLWFNEADAKAGGVIETEERESICAILEEMAHVARQKTLVEEIDEWRDW
jgi:hypothetical protein